MNDRQVMTLHWVQLNPQEGLVAGEGGGFTGILSYSLSFTL
jgi:hypothetical protein